MFNLKLIVKLQSS